MRFWKANRSGVVFASEFDYTTCPTFATEVGLPEWVDCAKLRTVEQIIG